MKTGLEILQVVNEVANWGNAGTELDVPCAALGVDLDALLEASLALYQEIRNTPLPTSLPDGLERELEASMVASMMYLAGILEGREQKLVEP